MIRDEGIARHVSNVMLDINNRLELSVAIVREHCSADETKQYGISVGRLICEIFDRILDPLYLEHPSLKPPGLE
jgi:hypothetical protein